MRISKHIGDLSTLKEYGFSSIEENIKSGDIDSDEVMHSMRGYALVLGHSRRGQFYYLVAHHDRTVSIFASKPDGSPSPLILNDEIINLINNQILVKVI